MTATNIDDQGKGPTNQAIHKSFNLAKYHGICKGLEAKKLPETGKELHAIR